MFSIFIAEECSWATYVRMGCRNNPTLFNAAKRRESQLTVWQKVLDEWINCIYSTCANPIRLPSNAKPAAQNDYHRWWKWKVEECEWMVSKVGGISIILKIPRECRNGVRCRQSRIGASQSSSPSIPESSVGDFKQIPAADRRENSVCQWRFYKLGLFNGDDAVPRWIV